MAEGGYDPTDPTTETTPLIPNKGDDDDDDANDPWKNIDFSQPPPPNDPNSTFPFDPDAASTPAGEQVPMSTRTKLPQEKGPRIEETSFGGRDSKASEQPDIAQLAGRQLTMPERAVLRRFMASFQMLT